MKFVCSRCKKVISISQLNDEDFCFDIEKIGFAYPDNEYFESDEFCDKTSVLRGGVTLCPKCSNELVEWMNNADYICKMNNLIDENKNLKNDVRELHNDIDYLKVRNRTLSEDYRKLTRFNTTLMNNNKNLADDNKRLIEENVSLTEANRDFSNEIHILTDENKNLKNDVRELHNDINYLKECNESLAYKGIKKIILEDLKNADAEKLKSEIIDAISISLYGDTDGDTIKLEHCRGKHAKAPCNCKHAKR